MNDNYESWLVEQHVELGNESFWHEKGRLFRKPFQSEVQVKESCHLIGKRDVLKYGGRYRIRVVKEETVYDSEEIAL
ncbi:hypothetical protein ACFWNC_14805 [Streptomyces sp. NPDC058369]|uniref:hypothetical protein n=1 Tax=Streptomyces sp. NPDC058369 TaxID=3346462 RepID=UPI00365FA453